jgi:hypothetical protein
LGLRVIELPAQWFERNMGMSRFQVFKWATAYLHWYFYIFATTFLRRKKI